MYLVLTMGRIFWLSEIFTKLPDDSCILPISMSEYVIIRFWAPIQSQARRRYVFFRYPLGKKYRGSEAGNEEVPTQLCEFLVWLLYCYMCQPLSWCPWGRVIILHYYWPLQLTHRIRGHPHTSWHKFWEFYTPSPLADSQLTLWPDPPPPCWQSADILVRPK